MSDASDQPQPQQADRDRRGRFAAGNRIASGNGAARRQHALAAAVAGAVTADELAQVLCKLRDLALAGDTQAAGLLLLRALGRPREQEPALALELPPLASAGDIGCALEHITKAAAAGELPLAAATQLAGLVGAVADARIVSDLDARLRALETNRAKT